MVERHLSAMNISILPLGCEPLSKDLREYNGRDCTNHRNRRASEDELSPQSRAVCYELVLPVFYACTHVGARYRPNMCVLKESVTNRSRMGRTAKECQQSVVKGRKRRISGSTISRILEIKIWGICRENYVTIRTSK